MTKDEIDSVIGDSKTVRTLVWLAIAAVAVAFAVVVGRYS